MFKLITYIIIFVLFMSTSSKAYLGPGLGGGMIAAILGFIIAIIAFFFGLIWFPIKKILKKKRENSKKKESID